MAKKNTNSKDSIESKKNTESKTHLKNVEQKQVLEYERDASPFTKAQHDVEKDSKINIESAILRHPERNDTCLPLC